MKLLKIEKSSNKLKKFTAIFLTEEGKEKKVSFGQNSARDYTLINDKNSEFYLPKKIDRESVKTAYRTRHEKDLKTNEPMKAGYLSYYLLWNLPTLEKSIKDYKKRFKL